MKLNARSLKNLTGVHPGLVRIVNLAADKTDLDFLVNEGVRTAMRQAELVRAGASRTMHSKHLVQPDGYGHAVDLVALLAGEVCWNWPLYQRLAVTMKAAAAELKIPLTWGGDWNSFRDGVHFELSQP
jgi:peptidoglycan L-alanyl-D-glutamate endopeptidase CwlK